MSPETIKNVHVLTIAMHIVIAALIIFFVYHDMRRNVYFVAGFLLLISVLALWPILSKSYSCHVV